MALQSVQIGNKHMYNDYGLIMAKSAISSPSPQIKRVDVPMRNGSLDLTNVLTDEVFYNDRKITLEFLCLEDRSKFPDVYSEIANYMHGQRMRIIFDADQYYYYIGRVEIDQWKTDRQVGKLALTCTVEPFKFVRQSSAEDWEWDIFDFENGIINEFGNLEINGTVEIMMICFTKQTTPLFIADSDMIITYDGVDYQIHKGTQKIYEILFSEGEHTLTITGNGTLTIDYSGGSL